jgi:hypothetical protein
MKVDRQDLEDLIADAIADSFYAHWNERDGAIAVVKALEEGGLVKFITRGTECPSSPTGFHIVDTSMESGPNNCFHCEGKVKL